MTSVECLCPALAGVRESDVETVAPKKGKRVMVVQGKEKGARGILMDKDTKKNKVRCSS